MRATYGGISIGIAAVLFYLSRNQSTVRLSVLAIIWIVSGMAIGRFIGIVFDSSPNSLMYIFLFLEIAIDLIGVVIVRKK